MARRRFTSPASKKSSPGMYPPAVSAPLPMLARRWRRPISPWSASARLRRKTAIWDSSNCAAWWSRSPRRPGRAEAADGGHPQHRFSGHLRGGGDAGVRRSPAGWRWCRTRNSCARAWRCGISSTVAGGCRRRRPRRGGSGSGFIRALGVPACLVSLRTAEMIKYACNAFHAVKIAFANEIGALGGQPGRQWRGGDDDAVPRCPAEMSPAYLKPGFAFGGSCLPKDLRALVYRAGRLDLSSRCSNRPCPATSGI